jgi:hypothetical protein
MFMYSNRGSGVPRKKFFMSIIIMEASLVERVLLIRILKVVISAVEVATGLVESVASYG